MTRILTALALLVVATAASAQTVTEYELAIFAVGATAPTSTTRAPVASVTCNLVPPPPATSTVNPRLVIWDDPAVAGRVCQWDLGAPATVLVSLPVGSYRGVLRFVNAAGVGPDSTDALFSRVALPAAPTGVRLTR